MKKFILPILILGLMVVAMPSYAAIYVDSENGDDSNVLHGCAEETPCATFASSRHLLNSDDTMYLSGEFNEQIELYQSDSGTEEAPKLISVWPERTATFTYAGNVINILGTNYITFGGLIITNNNTATKNGIKLQAQSGNITIQNCTIHDIGQRGISIGESLSNININNNTIYNIQQNGIHISGGNVDILVTDNTVYQAGLSGNGSGILAGGKSIINRNDLYQNPFAIIATGPNLEEVTISNNYIHGNSRSSLMLMDSTTTVNIYNNTFYEDNTNQILTLNSNYSGENLNLKNNIFYFADTSGLIGYLAATPTNLDSDYNLFYTPNLPDNNATYFNAKEIDMNFSQWQEAGYDAHSLNVDPLLTDVDNSDFSLTSTSPAIDAGTTLETITDDYDGDERYWGAAYDIGADEYLYLITPTNLSSTRYIYKADLDWDDVHQADSYNIKYGKGQDLISSTVVEATSEESAKTIENLNNAGRYYWQVQAVNGDIVSEWSETKRLITYPRKIKKGEIKITEKEATRARIRIDSMAKRVTGFNIIVAKKTGSKYKKVKTVKVSNKSAKNYTQKWLEDLTPDTKYRIKIKARRTIGSTKYLSQSAISKYFTTLAE